jgi:hypothetical protein
MDSESGGGQRKKSYSKQNYHGEIFNDLRRFAAIAANAALDAYPLTARVARSGAWMADAGCVTPENKPDQSDLRANRA